MNNIKYGQFDATKQKFTRNEWESMAIGAGIVLIIIGVFLL